MKQAICSRWMGAGALAAALAMLSPSAASARDTIHQPKPGSRERRAIFNALRVPVGREMKHAVVFQGTLKVSKSGWAFFSGSPLLDDGKGGKPSANAGEGSGDEMVALLRLRNGKWRVLSYGFGGGMDEIEHEKKAYPQAPRALFRSD